MKFLTALMLCLLGAGMASASTFKIYDHPSRADAATYVYGLRLESAPGSGAADYWSFQDIFGKSRVLVHADKTYAVGSVEGIMRHTLDDSDWKLSLTLTGITTLAPIRAGTDSFAARSFSGVLTNGTTTYDLVGKARNVAGFAYEWTYFSHNPGGVDWRLPNISAGSVSSLDGGQTMTIGTNDFIGIMTPIPVPAAGWLLLSAMGLIGLRRKRA